MDEFNKKEFRQTSPGRNRLAPADPERLKARVKAADQYKARIPREMRKCECCGWHPPAPLLARDPRLFLLHAHHILPMSRGGSDDFDNLVLLCANCHDLADYLSGRSAVPDPIRTREQLMAHLILLTTDPEEWDRRDRARSAQIYSELSFMIAEELHKE